MPLCGGVGREIRVSHKEREKERERERERTRQMMWVGWGREREGTHLPSVVGGAIVARELEVALSEI